MNIHRKRDQKATTSLAANEGVPWPITAEEQEAATRRMRPDPPGRQQEMNEKAKGRVPWSEQQPKKKMATAGAKRTHRHRPGIQDDDDSCLPPSSFAPPRHEEVDRSGHESTGVAMKKTTGGGMATPPLNVSSQEGSRFPGAVAVAGSGMMAAAGYHNQADRDVELGDDTSTVGPATVVAHTVTEETLGSEEISRFIAEFRQEILRERPVVAAELMPGESPQEGYPDNREKPPFWTTRRCLLVSTILVLLVGAAVAVLFATGTLPGNRESSDLDTTTPPVTTGSDSDTETQPSTSLAPTLPPTTPTDGDTPTPPSTTPAPPTTTTASPGTTTTAAPPTTTTTPAAPTTTTTTVPPTPPLPSTVFAQRITGREDGDRFGDSVAFSKDGTTLAVGAEEGAGYVRVYRRSGTQFSQIGQTLEGDETGDQFGRIVALNGDGSVLAVGAWNNDDAGKYAGHAKVFWYNGDSWTKVGQTLRGDKDEDRFGWYVSLSDDGDTVAASARLGDPSDDRVDAGYARVFTYSGNFGQSTDGDWVQLGTDLVGEEPDGQFGKTLWLDAAGRRLAVGAPFAADGKGRVQVFDYTNGTWDPVGQALDGQDVNDYHSEVSLSSDGSTLAIGMSGYDMDKGLARVYKLNGAVWTQHGQDLVGETMGDSFGANHITLSGDGNCLAVGANLHDNLRGKGYLFWWSNSEWNEITAVTGDREGSRFAYSQALSYDCSWLAFGASELDQSESIPDVPGYVLIHQVVA